MNSFMTHLGCECVIDFRWSIWKENKIWQNWRVIMVLVLAMEKYWRRRSNACQWIWPWRRLTSKAHSWIEWQLLKTGFFRFFFFFFLLHWRKNPNLVGVRSRARFLNCYWFLINIPESLFWSVSYIICLVPAELTVYTSNF